MNDDDKARLYDWAKNEQEKSNRLLSTIAFCSIGTGIIMAIIGLIIYLIQS